jgi:hypothetical protein
MHDLTAPAVTDDGDADPFPAISQRRRRGVRVTSAAAIALGLVLSGSAAAGAATTSGASTTSAASSGSPPASTHPGAPPFGGARPVAVGSVKSVADGTFVVTLQDGTTVNVEVSKTTTYFEPGTTSPSVADVTVGEHVAVFGTERSGTVTAAQVAIGTPPSGAKEGPGGKGAPPGTRGPGAPGRAGRPGGLGGTAGPGYKGGSPPTKPGTSSP